MVETGCLPPLVACLSSSNAGVQEQAAAALRVLSGNSDNQTRIVEEGWCSCVRVEEKDSVGASYLGASMCVFVRACMRETYSTSI